MSVHFITNLKSNDIGNTQNMNHLKSLNILGLTLQSIRLLKKLIN